MSMKTAAQYCLLSMAFISFRTLSVAENAPMTSSETRLHSGEGTVGFEMIGYLFVHFAFEDFRKVGQDFMMNCFNEKVDVISCY